MNIDLLVTQNGEAGLLCSENLVKKALGAVLDTQSGVLSLEYVDMDTMDLNIPIEEDFFSLLDAAPFLHVGSVKDGKIGQAYQIPLMIPDDPYRAQMLQHVQIPDKPLAAFHYFVKNCVLGQPAHRDDMGDEDTSGCILGDAVPSSLEFAPQLMRRHGLELQSLHTPEMNLPGMGLGTSGSARRSGGYRGTSSRTSNHSDKKDKE